MSFRTNDLHRVYLQAMFSRRVVEESVGLELYKRAVAALKDHDDTFRPTHDATRKGYQDFIGDLNNILENYGMLLKIEREESLRGKGMVILINTEANDVGLAASDLSPNEIAYLRDIIKEIMESYPGNSVGSTRALKIASDQKTKMTKVVAESLLDSMVSRGWFAKSARGRYSLAIRGKTELDPYLAENFDDMVRRCHRCNRLVLKGWVCENQECTGHWHAYCIDAIKRLHKGSCPLCHTSLDNVKPIGEDAVPRGQDMWSKGKGKRRRSGRGSDDGDEEGESEEEEDMLEEEEGGGFQSQDQSQSQDQDQGGTQAESQPPRRISNGGIQARWATETEPQAKRKRASFVPETQLSEEED